MAVLVILGLTRAPASGGAAKPVPNLVPLVTAVEIGGADGTCLSRVCSSQSSEPALRFSSGYANRGEAAFELFGEPDGPIDRRAMQCLSWATDQVCDEHAEVGRLILHAEHGHWHLEDFAHYELRRLRRNMTPDMSRRGLVVDGGKVSFCFADQERDDAGTTSSSRNQLYAYASCQSGMLMGLSPGWRDIYPSTTEGQFLSLVGVKDGLYALVITADPDGRLKEYPTNDNISITGVRLSDDATKVEVVCQNEPGSMRCRPTMM